jgi:hypothetical protein
MPPEPLDYYHFRDQNLTPDQLATQPGLSSDPAIRRIALSPGATFRPGEFEALMQLSKAAQGQGENRDAINSFFRSPDRQGEIERAVAPNQEAAFQQLMQGLAQRQRQESFARAESGNIGGSVQASQDAALAGDASRQGSDLNAQFSGERSRLQQLLESGRVQEILNSYNLDPQLLASLEQRTHTYGVQGESNALVDQLRRQREGVEDHNDDEYSRAWGNVLNQAGTMYRINNNQNMNQDQQMYLQRQRGGLDPNTMVPATSPAGVPG